MGALLRLATAWSLRALITKLLPRPGVALRFSLALALLVAVCGDRSRGSDQQALQAASEEGQGSSRKGEFETAPANCEKGEFKPERLPVLDEASLSCQSLCLSCRNGSHAFLRTFIERESSGATCEYVKARENFRGVGRVSNFDDNCQLEHTCFRKVGDDMSSGWEECLGRNVRIRCGGADPDVYHCTPHFD